MALNGVSIAAPTGTITGLIGPNGAGKTTLFNACSGLLTPQHGSVVVDGRDVTRYGPSRRARIGLGRTFQKMELFDSLTVRENVMMGLEASMAGGAPYRHLIGRLGESKQVRIATDYAMDLCDLTQFASTPALALSTGQRRLVELARCLTGPFRILLLDEPSSGLDRIETRKFGDILKRIVEERGCGILLVEHDMSLALDVCERLFVLDFGNQIFTGTPTEILQSQAVRQAYLGDADLDLPESISVAKD